MSDDGTRIMSDAEMDAADRLAEKRLAEARARPADSDVEARVRQHLQRLYRMEVRGNPEEGYLATAPELPGCMTVGTTPDEALRNLRDAMATWLEAAIVAGDSIPEPDEDRYSGRMLLRMPKSLHARLAEQSGRENVSINQLAVALLAEGLGQEREDLLADLERAFGISTLPAGVDRELRRCLLQVTRAILSGERWDPAADAPGSESVAAMNAYMRFIATVPPEVFDELRRRLDILHTLKSPSERSS